jgi:hypothetical protein
MLWNRLIRFQAGDVGLLFCGGARRAACLFYSAAEPQPNRARLRCLNPNFEGWNRPRMIRRASRNFPICSIIHPTNPKALRWGYQGSHRRRPFHRSDERVFQLLTDLAADADAARREFEPDF